MHGSLPTSYEPEGEVRTRTRAQKPGYAYVVSFSHPSLGVGKETDTEKDRERDNEQEREADKGERMLECEKPSERRQSGREGGTEVWKRDEKRKPAEGDWLV